MTEAGPTGAQRSLVVIALALLVIPGLVGFDAWPLTAWRLFSLARADSQTRWVLEAEGADGTVRAVSLEELPLRYRQVEWPMAALPDASRSRREALCASLLDAVVVTAPDTERLSIVRDRQGVVEREGEWVVSHDATIVHTCGLSGEPG